jgi:hypothetical protein
MLENVRSRDSHLVPQEQLLPGCVICQCRQGWVVLSSVFVVDADDEGAAARTLFICVMPAHAAATFMVMALQATQSISPFPHYGWP